MHTTKYMHYFLRFCLDVVVLYRSASPIDVHLLGSSLPCIDAVCVPLSCEYLTVFPPLQDLRFSLLWLWRMQSSVMWRRVALVGTDVLKDCIASIFRVKIISEIGTTLAVTSNYTRPRRRWRRHFLRNAVLARATRHQYSEDDILRVFLLLCDPCVLEDVSCMRWFILLK
jgi:hypothetical protein